MHLYCNAQLEAIDLYAKKYQLDVAQLRGDFDAERLNTWTKVLALRLALERSPYVVYFVSFGLRLVGFGVRPPLFPKRTPTLSCAT